MKSNPHINMGKVFGLLAAISFGCSLSLQADVVVLQSGAVITGKVLQQDANGVLMQMQYGTYRYPLTLIKDVKKEAATAPHVSNNGKVIPDWAQIVTLLADSGWAPEIKQVPAAMIEIGIWKNVPYISFRSTGGYELNIFGDLQQPAAVQIGAMNYLHQTSQEKSNCVNFICSVLANAADRKMVRALDFDKKDAAQNGAMKFETILPGEWGSYGGWWVSVCDTNALASARATDAEVLALTQPNVAQPAAATAQPAPAATTAAPDTIASSSAAAQPVTTSTTTYGYSDAYGWTAEEMAAAHPATAATATAAAANGDKVYPRTYSHIGGGYDVHRR